LDVRSNKDLNRLEEVLKSGEWTLFMAWAKWCPHCHTMMPHFDAAAKSPNRSIQAVKVEETMLPAVNQMINNKINKSAKPLNVEGYPSIILIDKQGNKVTDIEPVRNTKVITQVMNNVGPLAKEAGLNNASPTAIVENLKNNLKNINSLSINQNNAANAANMIAPPSLNTNKKLNNVNKNINKNNKKNLLANIGIANEGLVSGVNASPMNIDIGEDELKGSIASENTPKNNIKLNSVKNLSKTGNNIKTVKESLAESTAPSPINTTPSISGNNNNSKKIVPPPESIKQMSQEAEEATSLVAPLTPPSISGDLDQSENMESISNSLTAEQKVSGGGRGGSLYSAMARTTYTLAPAAALLATAAMVMKGRRRGKSHKRSKKSRRTTRRR
jgi:thiol-disulfide isomerase/thioredoxin